MYCGHVTHDDCVIYLFPLPFSCFGNADFIFISADRHEKRDKGNQRVGGEEQTATWALLKLCL
jgi:hypothetical protein